MVRNLFADTNGEHLRFIYQHVECGSWFNSVFRVPFASNVDLRVDWRRCRIIPTADHSDTWI